MCLKEPLLMSKMNRILGAGNGSFNSFSRIKITFYNRNKNFKEVKNMLGFVLIAIGLYMVINEFKGKKD